MCLVPQRFVKHGLRRAGRPVLRSLSMLPSPENESLVACPKCRGDLKASQEPHGWGCRSCRLLYPVIDGIPHLLVEDARVWQKDGGSV